MTLKKLPSNLFCYYAHLSTDHWWPDNHVDDDEEDGDEVTMEVEQCRIQNPWFGFSNMKTGQCNYLNSGGANVGDSDINGYNPIAKYANMLKRSQLVVVGERW